MLSYAITDFSTLNFESLDRDMERFSSKADMILYRDKKTQNYDDNAELFVNVAKKYPFKKVLLHNRIELAIRVRADGVHLSSDAIHTISFAKQKGLFVVVSTHNYGEAKEAEALGADMVTFSPIFDTPNKGIAVGLDKLAEFVSDISIPVIALGGIITTEQIVQCESVGAKGFASIRFFK